MPCQAAVSCSQSRARVSLWAQQQIGREPRKHKPCQDGTSRTGCVSLACEILAGWIVNEFDVAGERAQDQAGVLQRQELQEAHHAQGHTVQDRQGQPIRSGYVLGQSMWKQRALQGLQRLTTSLTDAGKRRYDRKQSGYGGQTKPVFHKKVQDSLHAYLSTSDVCSDMCTSTCSGCSIYPPHIGNLTEAQCMRHSAFVTLIIGVQSGQ